MRLLPVKQLQLNGNTGDEERKNRREKKTQWQTSTCDTHTNEQTKKLQYEKGTKTLLSQQQQAKHEAKQ